MGKLEETLASIVKKIASLMQYCLTHLDIPDLLGILLSQFDTQAVNSF